MVGELEEASRDLALMSGQCLGTLRKEQGRSSLGAQRGAQAADLPIRAPWAGHETVQTGGKDHFPQGTALPTSPGTHPPGLLYLASGQRHGVGGERHQARDKELCVPSRPWGPTCRVLPPCGTPREHAGVRWARPTAVGAPGESSTGAVPAGSRLLSSPSSTRAGSRPDTTVTSQPSVGSWSSAPLGVGPGQGRNFEVSGGLRLQQGSHGPRLPCSAGRSGLG